MGKKVKSKQRLDRFYHYAKEQGYRSRAAFKLIQLNRKYNFLNNANILIDLCAAPGGWLQVADQFMPLSSVKIGFDLVPIKHIPHVKTYTEDITSSNCLAIIKKEIKHMKADVVLHDGAPNVGANWQKDAYSQVELVLHSLKLATQVLKKGGTFVTKVFRSSDYNSLIWVFNKFFEKVEATKPEASRTSSAEIFVVCLRYLEPQYIDEKLFDTKHVFKDTEADNSNHYLTHEINSLSKLMQKRRWRGGYDEDMAGHLSKTIDFEEFLKMENPFPAFVIYNEMTIKPETKAEIEKYSKFPIDWEEMFKDLKVLGKREISSLLKWKGKINLGRRKERIKSKESKQNNNLDQDEIAEKENSEIELDEEIKEREHAEIVKQRKEKEKKNKQVFKYARNYGEESGIVPDEEEELFSIFKHKKIAKVGYVDIDEHDDQPQSPSKLNGRLPLKKSSIKEMEDNVELNYEMKLAKSLKSKKIKKNKTSTSNKKNKNVDFDDSELQCETIPSILPSEIQQTENISTKLNTKKWFDKTIFTDLKSDLINQTTKNQTFENPLTLPKESTFTNKPLKSIRKKNKNNNDSDSDGSEDKYAIKVPLSEMEKRRRRLKRVRERTEKKKKETLDPENDHEIEIVPKESNYNFEDFDLDELAETRALAKKMLRKRDRDKIIESTFHKYAIDEDEDAPNWFKDDENKHNHIIMPITKEEFAAEKERLYAINQKAPKKVIEAKIRNHKRMAKKMKKAKSRAEAIFDMEGIPENSKVKQINKLYKKELSGAEKKRKYVVGKKHSTGPVKKGSRNVRYVDTRLKKDRRADKRNALSHKIKKKSHKKFNRRNRK